MKFFSKSQKFTVLLIPFVFMLFLSSCVSGSKLKSHQNQMNLKIFKIQNEIKKLQKSIENINLDLETKLAEYYEKSLNIKRGNAIFKKEINDLLKYYENKISEMEDRISEMRILLSDIQHNP